MTVASDFNKNMSAIAAPRSAIGVTKDAGSKTSIILYLFVLSIVIPNYFFAGTLRLTPILLILLVTFFPLFILWIIGYYQKTILPDYLILLYCFWSSLSLITINGLDLSVQPIGIIFSQTFGSYLLGRLLIRNAQQLRNIVFFAAMILTLIFPLMLYETLYFKSLYLELFAKLGPTHWNFFMDPRWGLNRVQGPFEHPILFGIFSASMLALVFYGLNMGPLRHFRWVLLPVIVISSFISLSTGALLALIVQGFIIAWDFVFRKDPKRWRNLIILVVAAYVTVDLISNRTPFNVFVDYATFNSGSAYNRILIWRFGTEEVYRHPIFGIGLNDWVRPTWMHPSFDNFWLLQAMRYGLPAFSFMSLGFYLIYMRASKAVFVSADDNNIRKGLLISLVGVFFAISSVHLWSATYCWLIFLIGSSVWMFNDENSSDSSLVSQEDDQDLVPPEEKYASNIT